MTPSRTPAADASADGVRADHLQTLLDWALAVHVAQLPPDVVASAKDLLLNTTAAMLSGSAAPGAREIVTQLREWGGREQATVVAHGLRLPAPLAALANGVMAHAMDFDDTQLGTGLHANVSIVPALLAAAELCPEATGADFLAAQAAGLETACRMTLAAQRRAAHPWLTTTLFGIFGATVAAGRLLRLDGPTLRQAVGIVYSSAGGNRQGLLDGTLIQRVQPGLCARAAIEAIGFARQGVTGALALLDGRYGLYPSYYGEDFDLDTLTAGLGDTDGWRQREIAIKAFPCCSYNQEPIEAALLLLRDAPLDPLRIERVVATVVSEHAAGLVRRPFEPRSCPQVDAQFSMQYVIAATLVRGALGLDDFQSEAFVDPAVKRLAARVETAVDPDQAGRLDIHLDDGRVRSARIDRVKGHPERRFERAELQSRLTASGRLAHRPRRQPELDALMRTIRDLENVESAAILARPLA